MYLWNYLWQRLFLNINNIRFILSFILHQSSQYLYPLINFRVMKLWTYGIRDLQILISLTSYSLPCLLPRASRTFLQVSFNVLYKFMFLKFMGIVFRGIMKYLLWNNLQMLGNQTSNLMKHSEVYSWNLIDFAFKLIY